MNYDFQPFWGYEDFDAAKIEASFFSSVSHIAELYQLDKPDVSGLSFPQNVAYSFEEIKKKFSTLDRTLDCIIVQETNISPSLATIKTFDTGMTLYYIPVKPLVEMMKTEKEQGLANVVLRVFAYLYQIVKIAFYREEGTYLNCEYDRINEWFNEDEPEDEEYRREQIVEMKELETAGDVMLEYISDPRYLNEFEINISNFKTKNEFDIKCKMLAERAFRLWIDFPEWSIYDSVKPDYLLSEGKDVITVDQYLSFFWSGSGKIDEILLDMASNEFLDIEHTIQPVRVQVFNQLHSKKENSFDFEKRLFSMLDDLAELLNQYKYEKY